MARPTAHVPDAELSVLKSLWDHGESTVRELTDRVYPDGGPSQLATVQKLLERLESRDLVRRLRRERPHRFRAQVAREDLIARRLRETAERLCEGSLTPLLTGLVEASPVSEEELAELRRLVRRLEARRGEP